MSRFVAFAHAHVHIVTLVVLDQHALRDMGSWADSATEIANTRVSDRWCARRCASTCSLLSEVSTVHIVLNYELVGMLYVARWTVSVVTKI